jgi:adenylate cyclase
MHARPGGAEVELSLLFADVRGSTGLAERMSPTAYSRLMNRFYAAATGVLIKTDAFIDKLVGDEVMGVYLPVFTGPNHARAAIQGAEGLLRATGHDNREGPWLPVGVGVHSGVCYFGTVKGVDGTLADYTALGDPVNVAARLGAAARPGEALVSEAAHAAAGVALPECEERVLSLRGRREPVCVRVLTVGQATAAGDA